MGLFRLMAGATRNLPVAHAGSLALVPGDERIPVHDWRRPEDRNAIIQVEGYLAEMQNLKGLSGAPVFVRPSLGIGHYTYGEGRSEGALALQEAPLLLGMWQGSWDAPAVGVIAAERGEAVRVPVGMGIVVPAAQILTLLNLPALEENRRQRQAERYAAQAAQPDAGGSLNGDRS